MVDSIQRNSTIPIPLQHQPSTETHAAARQQKIEDRDGTSPRDLRPGIGHVPREQRETVFDPAAAIIANSIYKPPV